METGKSLYGGFDRNQGILVVSPEGRVCVRRHPIYRSGKALGKCYISCLPDELLLEIFENFDGGRKFLGASRFTQCTSLSAVCKRWNRICEPLLLRSLFLASAWEKQRQTESLLMRFQRDPSPSCHVQELTIGYNCAIYVTVLSRCKLLRKLELNLGREMDSLPLIQVTGTLQYLQECYIHGYRGSPRDFQCLKQPSLRVLHMLSCILKQPVENNDSFLGGEPEDLRYRDLSSSKYADKILTAGFGAKSAFTELSVTVHQSSILSEAAEMLVRQSEKLERIALGGYDYHSCLQRILDVHQSTLHTISLSRARSELPDLSAFSSLRRLEIPWSQVQRRSPVVVSSKLPCSLGYLMIRFVNPHRIKHDSSKYGSRTGLSLWFFDLAVCHRNKNGGNKVLRTITVDLALGWWRIDRPDQTGPYEFLDDATRRLAELRMRLKLIQPEFSRDKWQRILAEAEKEEKDWERAQLRMDRYFRPKEPSDRELASG